MQIIDPTQNIDEIPPIDLTLKHKLYLEFSMIFCILFLYWFLRIDALTLSVVVYILFGLILIPGLYILFIAQEKDVQEYYIQGEFIFKKENNLLLMLQGCITVLIFLLFTILCIDVAQPQRKRSNDAKIVQSFIFGLLYIIILPIFEQLYWRCFLPKSYPANILSDAIVGFHYGILTFAVSINFFEWQISFVISMIYFLWHFILIYVRRVIIINNIQFEQSQKLSSVIVLGYCEKIGIYTALILMFHNTNWFDKLQMSYN